MRRAVSLPIAFVAFLNELYRTQIQFILRGDFYADITQAWITLLLGDVALWFVAVGMKFVSPRR